MEIAAALVIIIPLVFQLYCINMKMKDLVSQLQGIKDELKNQNQT